jgi:hypothetical protein
MIIQIQVRDQWIESLKNGLIKFIKTIYGWISKDDEFLGHVLASSHFIISATFYVLILACHIVYPSLYFQLFVFSCVVIIWLQHVFLRVCISIVAEKELTKLSAPSVPLFEIVLKYFNVTFEDFTNYFLTAETVCVGMFGLEIMSRLLILFYDLYNNGTLLQTMVLYS